MTKYVDSRLQDVIKLMKEIDIEAQRTALPKLTRDQVKAGCQSSRASIVQASEVAMSPLMKNALEHYGDIPKGSDKRLMCNDPQTKAENAIVSNIKQLLLRFNGCSNEYDESLNVFDKRHYDVQCHQNFKDNLRDIQPGQAEARLKMIKVYREPTKLTIGKMVDLIEKNPTFQKAIQIALDEMPSVRASEQIREINLPFMNKHSGVGAYYWRNDRTVGPNGKTYAEITMDEAEAIKDDYSKWDHYNVSTGYGRNQRGKGRLIIAVSRVLNLLLNMLEAEEIKAYKAKHRWFVGYGDDKALKQALIELGEYCDSNGYRCANEDYSGFDSTVGAGFIALIGAMSIIKSNGARSKKIAMKRAVAALRTMFVNGLTNDAREIFGRIFSGFIDTNRSGGLINGTAMTFCCMKQDPNYSHIVYDSKYNMFVMGDDNLHIYKVLDRSKLEKDMKEIFGFVMNSAKYEFGVVFLQYRVFKDPSSGKYVMAYAWPRVVRSLLFKEESKGLGPVGWTYAWYQQLAKLIEWPESLSIAVNLIMPFDNNKLFLDTPIEKLNQMLAAEDNEAYDKLKTDAQKRRHMKTIDKLYDGDPSKDRFNLSDVGFLEEVRNAIKAVYDPTFYNKYGLR